VFGFPITRDDGDPGDFGDLHPSVFSVTSCIANNQIQANS
jgi:hypothetical protein